MAMADCQKNNDMIGWGVQRQVFSNERVSYSFVTEGSIRKGCKRYGW